LPEEVLAADSVAHVHDEVEVRVAELFRVR
jgi:hypothetical protein